MRKARMILETTRWNADGEAVFEVYCPNRGLMNIMIAVTKDGCAPPVVVSDVEPPPPVSGPVGVDKVRVAMQDGHVPDASWHEDDVALFCDTNAIQRRDFDTKEAMIALCEAWRDAGSKRPPTFVRLPRKAAKQ